MTTPRRAPEVLLRRYWEDPDTPVVTRRALRAQPAATAARSASATWPTAGRSCAPGGCPCAVVSVGNLTLGGSGKTPTVELVVRTLRELGAVPAVVSRGYGRRHPRRARRGGPGGRPGRRAHRRRRAAAARRAAARRRGRGGRESPRGRPRRGRAARGDRARARRRLPAPHAREGSGDPRGPGPRAVGQCPRLSPRHAPRAARRAGPRPRDRGDQSAGPRGGGGGDRDGAALQSDRAGARGQLPPSGRRSRRRAAGASRWRSWRAAGSWPSRGSARPRASPIRCDAAGIRRVAFAEFPDHHWFTPGDLRELVAGRAGRRGRGPDHDREGLGAAPRPAAVSAAALGAAGAARARIGAGRTGRGCSRASLSAAPLGRPCS